MILFTQFISFVAVKLNTFVLKFNCLCLAARVSQRHRSCNWVRTGIIGNLYKILNENIIAVNTDTKVNY